MNKKNIFFVFIWIFFFFIFSTHDFNLKAKYLSNYQKQGGTLIRGKVQNDEGIGLQGIRVFLTGTIIMDTRTTVTSKTGDFSFFGLPSGYYKLEIEGFRILETSIDGLVVGCETIGLTVPEPGGVPKKKYIITVEKGTVPIPPPPPTPPPPTIILKATISVDSGLNKITKEIAQKDKSAFYSFFYSEEKIFAKKGIAKVKVGSIEKRLNKITQIPFRDEDYIQNGLRLEEKCVYSIRLGEKDEGKLIIRVLKKEMNEIEIEYYIVAKEVKDE